MEIIKSCVDCIKRLWATISESRTPPAIPPVTPVVVESPPISPTSRNISDAGIKLIQQWEGCTLRVVDDGAGYPTIGWGHLIVHPDTLLSKVLKITTAEVELLLHSHQFILTQAQADAVFELELQPFVKNINQVVHVPINQSEFDSLVSISYNIGVGAFNRSSLLRELNKGNYAAAQQQFLVWTHAGGRYMRGLDNRRHAEEKEFGSEGLQS